MVRPSITSLSQSSDWSHSMTDQKSKGSEADENFEGRQQRPSTISGASDLRISLSTDESSVRSGNARCTSGAASVTSARTSCTDVQSLTSFVGSDVKLRGAALSMIMKHACHTFAASAGSARDYEATMEREVLNFFISHNWSVHRLMKFISLSVYFNFDIALVAAGISALILGIINASGLLRGLEIEGLMPFPITILCRCSFVPVFLIVLFLGRDIQGWFGFRGPLVFLDKVCINQEDPELKFQSIQRLGAFINNSEKMLVLYTDVYLKKLWTIYEVASFLSLHPLNNMIVLPVEKDVVYICAILIAYTFGLSRLVWQQSYEGSQKVQVLAYLFVGLCYVGVWRCWNRSKSIIQNTLRKFTLKESMCAVEDDRPLVYANIATLMKGTEKVSETCSEEEALHSFEEMVRGSLAYVFVPRSFKLNFQYKHYVLLGISHEGILLVDSMTAFHQHDFDRHHLALTMLYLVFLSTTLFPMSSFGLEFVAHQYPLLRGWKEKLWILAGYIIVVFLPGVASDATWRGIILWGTEGDHAWVALCIGVLLPFFSGWCVSRLHGRYQGNVYSSNTTLSDVERRASMPCCCGGTTLSNRKASGKLMEVDHDDLDPCNTDSTIAIAKTQIQTQSEAQSRSQVVQRPSAKKEEKEVRFNMESEDFIERDLEQGNEEALANYDLDFEAEAEAAVAWKEDIFYLGQKRVFV